MHIHAVSHDTAARRVAAWFHTVAAVLVLSAVALANTPGKHSITYKWVDAACDNSLTCSYNLYFGTATGVCGDGKFPTKTGITPATYTTGSLSGGTYFAAVTAFDPTTGGESTCSAEVQTPVPSTTTPMPTNPTGAVN